MICFWPLQSQTCHRFRVSKELMRNKPTIGVTSLVRFDWYCESFPTPICCVDWRSSRGCHWADWCRLDGWGKGNVFTVGRGKEHEAHKPEGSGVLMMLSRNLESFRISLKPIQAGFYQPLFHVYKEPVHPQRSPGVPNLLAVHWKSPRWRTRAKWMGVYRAP